MCSINKKKKVLKTHFLSKYFDFFTEASSSKFVSISLNHCTFLRFNLLYLSFDRDKGWFEHSVSQMQV